jgi:hypothetical protein
MGTTPTYALPYPELTDPADVPADIKKLATRLDLGLGVPLVTALPSSPIEGQECHLQTAAMAGYSPPLMWHLRYRATKWCLLGGAPLFAEIDPYVPPLGGPDRTVTSLTYVELAVPLTVVVPVVGWYDIELGVGGYHSTAGGLAAMSHDIGATAAVDNDGLGWQQAGASDVHRVGRSQRKQLTGTAPLTLRAKFRTSTGTATFRGPKTIKATPVLLG